MGTIGHNSGSLTSAAEANVETGIWLLAKEFLVTAIQDRKLDRGHLRVLACFAQLMNRSSGKAWPSRGTLAAMSGMTPKAVSTAVYELKQRGYLISGKEPVELSGNEILTVYTFGNIDHDTIRREITAFVEGLKQVRSGAESSPHRGNSTSPPTGNIPVQGEQKPPQKGNFPAEGEQPSSPHTGTSNSIERTNNSPPPQAASEPKKKVSKHRTQIQANWTPRAQQVEWVKSQWCATDAQILKQTYQFRDHHASKGSLMADWDAAWRTWWGNEFHKIPRRHATPENDLVERAMRPASTEKEIAQRQINAIVGGRR
jgi:hypothetical protein